MLLFRGADRAVKNYANQTAADVAVITDNVHLADLIHKFKSSDVGKPVFIRVNLNDRLQFIYQCHVRRSFDK